MAKIQTFIVTDLATHRTVELEVPLHDSWANAKTKIIFAALQLGIGAGRQASELSLRVAPAFLEHRVFDVCGEQQIRPGVVSTSHPLGRIKISYKT